MGTTEYELYNYESGQADFAVANDQRTSRIRDAERNRTGAPYFDCDFDYLRKTIISQRHDRTHIICERKQALRF